MGVRTESILRSYILRLRVIVATEAKPQIKPAAIQVLQRRGHFRGQPRVSRSVAVEQRTDPGLWGATNCRKRYIDENLVESIAQIDAVVIDSTP